ncbi:hypothetical protein ACHAWU_005002 [Discostella pseudostelligera]|uniref:Uncharacterized protein n=1 Tax=Discostella pseudostelligera TaxID=259834 RepID=A0ABD3MMC6_9STRA
MWYPTKLQGLSITGQIRGRKEINVSEKGWDNIVITDSFIRIMNSQKIVAILIPSSVAVDNLSR